MRVKQWISGIALLGAASVLGSLAVGGVAVVAAPPVTDTVLAAPAPVGDPATCNGNCQLTAPDAKKHKKKK